VRKSWVLRLQPLVMTERQNDRAEILVNPAPRRRQATMTISLNPLRSTRKSAQIDVIS
jgi:hypothetical protein